MAIDEIQIDGLLPHVPRGGNDCLARRAEASGQVTAIVHRALRLIGDIHATRHIVWPARIDGELAPPPAAHLVDHVVRTHVLDGGPGGPAAESGLRPEAFTIVAVAEPPACSACHMPPARYETRIQDSDSWSCLCPACYLEQGTGRLGVGEGQYLVTQSEVDAPTREAMLAAKRYWSARGVSVPEHDPWW